MEHQFIANPEQSAEIFQKQLLEITDRQLTVDDIDIYANQALNDVIELVEKVISAYGQSFPNRAQSKSEYENQAFDYYNLQSVEAILDHIANKQDELEQIDQVISKVAKINRIILPPDARQASILKGAGGNGDFQLACRQPKLKTLLFLLGNHFGLDVHDQRQVSIIEGRVNSNMMRQQPYYEVHLPDINRRVMVCDESGNVTFVFNDDKLPQEVRDVLKDCTKQELDKLIRGVPGCGVRIVNSKKYLTNLINALECDIKTPEQLERTVDTKFLSIEKATAPKAPDGYLTVNGIIKKLGLSRSAIIRVVKKFNLQPEKYKSLDGNIHDYFSPDQIRQIETNLTELLQTTTAPEGYLTAGGIAKKLGLSKSFITKTIKELKLQSEKYKDTVGRVSNYFSPDQTRQIKVYLADLLQTEIAPEGYLTTMGIAKKFDLNWGTVARIVEELNLQSKRYKGVDGNIHDYFSPDQIRQIETNLTELLQTTTAPEGYLTTMGIAKKFDLNWGTVANTAEELKLQSEKYKDEVGRVSNYFSPDQIRQIETNLTELLQTTTAPEGYLTIKGITKKLSLSRPVVAQAIEELNLQSKKCKSMDGNIHDYFSPAQIQRVEDCLAELLRFERAPDGYLTAFSTAKKLGLNYPIISRIVEELNLQPEQYRSATGKVTHHFSPNQQVQIIEHLRQNPKYRDKLAGF